MAPGGMRAGSEGVYGIVGVPPGEILFHSSAQPECCVLLRSEGCCSPHKAGSVWSSSEATVITHSPFICDVLWNRYGASALSKLSPRAQICRVIFLAAQNCCPGSDPSRFSVALLPFGKQGKQFQVLAQEVFRPVKHSCWQQSGLLLVVRWANLSSGPVLILLADSSKFITLEAETHNW